MQAPICFVGSRDFYARLLSAVAILCLVACVAPLCPAQQPPAAAPSAIPQDSPQQAPVAAPQNQTPAAAPQDQPQQTASQNTTTAAPTPQVSAAGATEQIESQNEEHLRQLLVGKPLYIRGGYLDNSLSFDEHGRLVSHSPQGSYTLSAIEIQKVRLTKHKVELEGIRYGLHFLGELPYEDAASSFDRVRITPKKKVMKITIDRELVVKPKKEKEKKPDGKTAAAAAKTKPPAAPAAERSEADPIQISSTPPPASAAAETASPSDADSELKKSIAATPAAERPADEASVTTTTSPAHAAKLLNQAIEKIFAHGLDDQMMAAMPDFWKLYYKAVAAKSDYRPTDPAVMRQNSVDRKARLLTQFEPSSNEYAQSAEVAGMALYHAVVGADGKPGEVAVARPIGFGLDENAVDSIRKASFQPAIKDGKPVPVLLDLVVQFRIYSKRTAVVSAAPSGDKPAEQILPGPYSANQK